LVKRHAVAGDELAEAKRQISHDASMAEHKQAQLADPDGPEQTATMACEVDHEVAEGGLELVVLQVDGEPPDARPKLALFGLAQNLHAISAKAVNFG
jgi:hypothetical protein